jgi:hypothetical protein
MRSRIPSNKEVGPFQLPLDERKIAYRELGTGIRLGSVGVGLDGWFS